MNPEKVFLPMNKNREPHLRLKSEFDYLRSSGRKTVARSFVLVAAPSPDGTLRCGVVCSKKYSLLAVKRNRARRLLYESFRLLHDEFAPTWLLLIPRSQMAERKCQEVVQEMRTVMCRAGLVAGEQ
ncbi:MAG: ribonuclease P protein component [Victivallaceae bacterium]|nr:ribonuclease P protein component [Victivallaceae bacterium]